MPATAATEKSIVVPVHIADDEEIAPGCAGIVCTEIATEAEGPLPHGLEGTTLIFPDEAPTVKLTEELPCPELMIQSDGKLQV